MFILGLYGGKFPQNFRNPTNFKMNYDKIEFLSISGVIFSSAHRGSVPGPDLPFAV